MNEWMRACASHEINGIVLNARFHARSRNLRATMKDRVRIGERPYVNLIETLRIEAIVPTRHYLALVRLVWVAQQDLQLEAIELGLGQWIRSLILDRVLGRENGKDRRQLVSIAVDRDLAFFHRFQQRRLRFRRSAVDLVGQQDVREYRATPQSERRIRDVEDVRARDIGWHQVGRELDTTETGVDDSRQGFDRKCFRRAGHAFDERVSLGKQRDQDLFDRIVLSDDYLVQLSANVFDSGGDGLRHWLSVITQDQMFSAACLSSRERMRRPRSLSTSRNRRTRSIDCRQLHGAPLITSSHWRISVSNLCASIVPREAMREAISVRELL